MSNIDSSQMDMAKKKRKKGSRGIQLLFSQSIITSLTPVARSLRQSPNARDTLSPVGLGCSAEGIGALRRDDSYALQYGLSGIAAEDCGVVDPLKRGLEICVESTHGMCVNRGRRRDSVSLRGGGVSLAEGRGLGRRSGNGRVAAASGFAARAGGRGEGWKSAFAETLEDTPGFIEEVHGAVVLAPGDKSKGASEHVGGEELHASLDDGGVWGDGRSGGALALGAWVGRQHGDGQQGRARGVGEMTVAKEISVGEVRLDQGNFFDADNAGLVTIGAATQCF
jgi:hypothetical protein